MQSPPSREEQPTNGTVSFSTQPNMQLCICFTTCPTKLKNDKDYIILNPVTFKGSQTGVCIVVGVYDKKWHERERNDEAGRNGKI